MAILALAVPMLGFGLLPTVFALFLYGLLPVVRNTIAGLVQDNLAYIIEGTLPAAILAILADQLLANVEGVFAYSSAEV